MTVLLHFHRTNELSRSLQRLSSHSWRYISSTKIHLRSHDIKTEKKDTWSPKKVNAYVGHSFPDFIEGWNRDVYRKVGYGLAASSSFATGGLVLFSDHWTSLFVSLPILSLWTVTGGYWYLGEKDIAQNQHAIRRNYPVLGNMRYILETVSTKS